MIPRRSLTPRSYSCLYVLLHVCLVMLSGCSSTETYNKNYYVLNVNRQKDSTGTQTDFILEVSRFTIDSAFSGSGLVYRVGDSEYEQDFYNEFLASPSAMISDTVRNWLSTSRLFMRVIDPGSQVDPTHIIEGNIIALYGDFRERSSPRATIEMRLFLLRMKAGEEPIPIFGKTYKSSIDVVSDDPEGLVEAYGRCLEKILSTLESDLVKHLS